MTRKTAKPKKKPTSNSASTRTRKGRAGKLTAQDVATVEQWISSPGLLHGDVVKRITKRWGVSARTAERYISRIYERWEDEDQHDRKARRAKMRTRLENAFERAMKKADDAKGIAMASRILDQLAKLDGLYAPKEHQVHHSGEVTLDAKVMSMTPAQRAKRLAELEEKRRAVASKESR